jgi:hypothetical protein
MTMFTEKLRKAMSERQKPQEFQEKPARRLATPHRAAIVNCAHPSVEFDGPGPRRPHRIHGQLGPALPQHGGAARPANPQGPTAAEVLS